jgi:glycosyltransferase involved in cell wall biosynthesis
MARRADVLLANGLLHATTLANMIVRRPCAVKVVGDFAWERARNRNLTTQEFTAFQSAAHARPLACWQRERTRCLNRARAVLVPSEFLRCVVEAWGITRPIHVIPNGIDDAFVRAADGADLDEIRRKYTLSDRFLLYAGRLTNWKGCDTLIRLLPTLAADLGLVIVGDGPERGALKAIAKRLDLGKRVRFVPPVDRARTAALMRLAACFVLNSGYEGHPHVVLEAMAVGTPVAAARQGGTPELVQDGENGLLFDKDNAPQMIERLERLLDDEALRRGLIEGGRATAQRFPWSATLEQTEALLAQLAERRR